MPKIILAARGRITTHHQEQLPNRSWKHRGIDQGHGDGEPVDLEIRAPAAGKVIAVGADGSYGQRIIILHDDFSVSLLAHHKTQLVKAGERVAQRQLIAVMGNTGTIYVHSHQEYRDRFGGQLDPLKHLAATTVAIDEPAPLPDLPPIPVGDDDMIRIQAPGRGIALVGAGYYRHLHTDEEVAVSETLMTKHVTGNDRQFDLWVSLASAGTSAPAAGNVVGADVAAAVIAAIGAQVGGVTLDTVAVAAAVDRALADNFADIPGAVRSAIVK